MLQKYDLEQHESQCKFNLQRDEALRRFMAAIWGVELKSDPVKSSELLLANERRQTMTRQDLMRNYSK